MTFKIKSSICFNFKHFITTLIYFYLNFAKFNSCDGQLSRNTHRMLLTFFEALLDNAHNVFFFIFFRIRHVEQVLQMTFIAPA